MTETIVVQGRYLDRPFSSSESVATGDEQIIVEIAPTKLADEEPPKSPGCNWRAWLRRSGLFVFGVLVGFAIMVFILYKYGLIGPKVAGANAEIVDVGEMPLPEVQTGFVDLAMRIFPVPAADSYSVTHAIVNIKEASGNWKEAARVGFDNRSPVDVRVSDLIPGNRAVLRYNFQLSDNRRTSSSAIIMMETKSPIIASPPKIQPHDSTPNEVNLEISRLAHPRLKFGADYLSFEIMIVKDQFEDLDTSTVIPRSEYNIVIPVIDGATEYDVEHSHSAAVDEAEDDEECDRSSNGRSGADDLSMADSEDEQGIGRCAISCAFNPPTNPDLSHFKKFHVKIDGLLPGQKINFKIRVTNSVGTSQWSTNKSFTTNDINASEPSVASNFQVTENLWRAISVNWAPPANNGRSTIIKYIVQATPYGWSTGQADSQDDSQSGQPADSEAAELHELDSEEIDTGSDSDGSIIYEFDGETYSSILKDLKPGKTYSLTIQAVNSIGASPLSTPIIITTFDECSPDSAENLHAMHVWTDAVAVGWNLPKNPNCNKPLTSIEVVRETDGEIVCFVSLNSEIKFPNFCDVLTPSPWESGNFFLLVKNAFGQTRSDQSLQISPAEIRHGYQAKCANRNDGRWLVNSLPYTAMEFSRALLDAATKAQGGPKKTASGLKSRLDRLPYKPLGVSIISDQCLSCFGDNAKCASQRCTVECAQDGYAERCHACVRAKCRQNLLECASYDPEPNGGSSLLPPDPVRR